MFEYLSDCLRFYRSLFAQVLTLLPPSISLYLSGPRSFVLGVIENEEMLSTVVVQIKLNSTTPVGIVYPSS